MGARTTCEDNFVEIIEGNTSETQDRRVFCGEDNPAPYVSKTSRVTIRMKKNSNFGGTGWLINFMAVGQTANENITY